MPKPSYIICSSSGCIDKYTNLVSIFNVIERFSVVALEKDDAVKALQPLSNHLHIRITAAWYADEDDVGKEFEYEFSFKGPGGDEFIIGQKGTFVFAPFRHRLIGDFDIEAPGAGILVAANTITRDGFSGRQEYLIQIAE